MKTSSKRKTPVRRHLLALAALAGAMLLPAIPATAAAENEPARATAAKTANNGPSFDVIIVRS